MRALRSALPTFGVFLACLLGLVVRQQVTESGWIPRGADWDTWYTSALAIRAGTLYPSSRWPLYGALAAVLDLVLPGPLHLHAMVVSLTATALSAAGLFHLGQRTMGTLAGLVVAALLLLFPMNLEMAAWMNGYPLWVAGAVWAVVGVAEGARSPRAAPWALAGLGGGAVLAVMAKGIGLGALLGATAVVVALLAHRRRAGRPLVAFALPVLALALAYAAFPRALMSLDTQALLPETAAVDSPAAPAALGVAPMSREDGYVFGKSMGPLTVWRTLALVHSLNDPTTRALRLERSKGMLAAAFPGVGPVHLGLLALGALAGLWTSLHQRRWDRLAAWSGATVVVLGGMPALSSNLNLRFLAPGMAMVPLFAVGLATLPLRRLPWAPLLALGLLSWSASPWRTGAWTREWMTTGGARFETGVWYDLDTQFPGVPIWVDQPLRGGLFAVDGRGGGFLDPQTPLEQATAPLDPAAWLLVWIDEARDDDLVGKPATEVIPGASENLARRTIRKRWVRRDRHTGTLVLLSP